MGCLENVIRCKVYWINLKSGYRKAHLTKGLAQVDLMQAPKVKLQAFSFPGSGRQL